MTTSGKKGGGGGKPFLADDDDLLSELDAWDATFDALHEHAGELPSEPPMAWPAPTPQPEPSSPSAELATGGRDLELEEQLTLDHAVEHVAAGTFDHEPEPAAPVMARPDEIDFSGLGADGHPAALGDLLGRFDEEAEDVAVATQIDLASVLRAEVAPPPFAESDDDYAYAYDVVTSASRASAPGLTGEDALDDDPLAPPPEPMRRGPAIVRRPSAAAIPSPIHEDATPARGIDASAIAESARLLDDDAHPTEAARSSFTPRPARFDDSEYDVEIDASAPIAPLGAERSEPAARRTAHVVRRAQAVTRPPSLAHLPGDDADEDVSVEMVVDEAGAPGPAQPDDFSDLAAAFGATPDPVMEGGSAADELRFDLDEPAPEPLAPASAAAEAPRDHGGAGELGNPATDVEVAARAELAQLGELGELAAAPMPADPYRIKTPTSVPPIGASVGLGVAPARAETPPALHIEPPFELSLDLHAAVRAWPEQVAPIAASALDEDAAASLLVFERELASIDESAASAALRLEAGRLCEQLHDHERARAHYDAAVLADPRATAALRGLRRIARASGDLVEAVRQLDAEIAVAGALERLPLGRYRVDLLMASGEHDLARVAVGEVLDVAPMDVRGLLARLELAFRDGRADEVGSALEQLAQAVSDPELRAAVQSARGALAAHHADAIAAGHWFAAAASSEPGSPAAWVGAVRQAAARADGGAAAQALLELARCIEAADPVTAAAAAVRAQQWASGELGAAAAQVAARCAPTDPLVARLAADTAVSVGDAAFTAAAFAHWAGTTAPPAERAYAAGRAAELDPGRGATLWGQVLELEPDDDYAAAQLRTAHVAADAIGAAIEIDLAMASDPTRERAALRAAYGLVAGGQLDRAVELLEQHRTTRPGSIAIAEALGEALAAGSRWSDRARLCAELAAEPGEQLDRDVAQLRSALAWEDAVGAAAVAEGGADDVVRSTTAALEAWEQVVEQAAATHSSAPAAHAAALLLASRLGDRDIYLDVLARAQAAERSPWAAASLGLRQARLCAAADPARAHAILGALPARHDDPRKTLALMLDAARRHELADAASALEDRAGVLEGAPETRVEAATLQLRAAQIALDAGEAVRATTLLGRVEQRLPQLGVVPDLLATARRRAGERSPVSPARRAEASAAASSTDLFARIVRDADLAAASGDGAEAVALYQRALELRPGDPLARVPLVRVATQLRDSASLASLALAQLRAAEQAGDGVAKASAYEMLAQIDGELRSDHESAQVALESALQADPSRIDLMHRLERRYATGEQLAELQRLRKAELDVIPAEHARDRAALLIDLSGIAVRDGRPEHEVVELYRRVIEADPRARLALMHLEASVRRGGASPELAQLEDQIATYFEGDPRTQAAFWTRAGETLAELGQIDDALQRFGAAERGLPGHAPALEGWRLAALKGQRWAEAAEAASREAASTSDGPQRAALLHFAGVALMDKALVGDQAIGRLRQALDAAPGHRDAFLRLRILLEEDANHDDLATLLAHRLDVEADAAARVELHRALAELHRNFLSDRDTAKTHYRAILASDPNDLRAHAAIADIAWEQGNWQEAAEALTERARLERQPDVLKTLCFRLGLIYADRLVDVPMALKAFQRALTYQPDDEATLVRLADLAIQAGEWKLALGACERLVKNEGDPERRVAHLHRVATIFVDGFQDQKRAERALNLALDAAPTSDLALARLVEFYTKAGDRTSARVHLNRVAGSMRARVAQAPEDGVGYRVIARAMAARAQAGLDGSQAVARAAAELADLLGASGEPEQALLGAQRPPALSALLRPDADDLLFPRSVQVELRQVFQLLGDRVAKHVGVDLRPYGVTRGDRRRAKDDATAAIAQSVATGLGFGDIDVYISSRQPWAMIAEPTSPVSLVIGSSIAGAGPDAIRFAAGAALKLAQASLSVAARLPPDELGVLVVGLLRVFQPEFPAHLVDAEAVGAQVQKLRRLIPSGLLGELRPFALAIDPQQFDHRALARDLKIAAARAGIVASGTLVPGLRVLAAQAERELPGFLADPIAQGVIGFALGEDHAVLAR